MVWGKFLALNMCRLDLPYQILVWFVIVFVKYFNQLLKQRFNNIIKYWISVVSYGFFFKLEKLGGLNVGNFSILQK